MEPSDVKAADPQAALPTSAPTQHMPAARPPSPPHSHLSHKTDQKVSFEAPNNATPPFSPSSQTPVLQKEQEEFEGSIDVNNDLPTEEDLKKVEDFLLLDAQGQSRPFKELYEAPLVAPRQLIIFIRHFFCGVCDITGKSSLSRGEHVLTVAELPRIPPNDILFDQAR